MVVALGLYCPMVCSNIRSMFEVVVGQMKGNIARGVRQLEEKDLRQWKAICGM